MNFETQTQNAHKQLKNDGRGWKYVQQEQQTRQQQPKQQHSQSGKYSWEGVFIENINDEDLFPFFFPSSGSSDFGLVEGAKQLQTEVAPSANNTNDDNNDDGLLDFDEIFFPPHSLLEEVEEEFFGRISPNVTKEQEQEEECGGKSVEIGPFSIPSILPHEFPSSLKAEYRKGAIGRWRKKRGRMDEIEEKEEGWKKKRKRTSIKDEQQQILLELRDDDMKCVAKSKIARRKKRNSDGKFEKAPIFLSQSEIDKLEDAKEKSDM